MYRAEKTFRETEENKELKKCRIELLDAFVEEMDEKTYVITGSGQMIPDFKRCGGCMCSTFGNQRLEKMPTLSGYLFCENRFLELRFLDSIKDSPR